MPRRFSSRLRIFCLCLTCLLSPLLEAHAGIPVKIGVLAFRPKPQTIAQWQPLTGALKEAIPEYDFEVVALSYPELEEAAVSRQLDFVLTNPAHYVVIKKRSQLSAPLATLEVMEQGVPATLFGGVIFTLASERTINTLADIKGKRIAAVAKESLGGYQMQAYELSQIGIRIPGEVQLRTTGMPHDKVVEAVLSGQATVGFIRSGVLEDLARKGKLDLARIKIINRQEVADFPNRISTRLYPEWPFVALAHIDENLARRVTATLLMLEENKALTQAMGIHGFVVPADYESVEDLLRALRLPPFDVVPSFTLHDVWVRFHWQLMAGLFACGLIITLSLLLFLSHRKLAAKQLLLLEQQQRLQESEEKFRTMADHTYDWEVWENAEGRLLYCSPSCERLTGHPPQALLAKPDLVTHLIHPDDLPKWQAHHAYTHDENRRERERDTKARELDFRIVLPNGTIRWISHICHDIRDEAGNDLGIRISNRDITERKRLEAELVKTRNLESLGILAGGLAHDFNNLFQALLGNLELARAQTEASSPAAPYLAKAKEISKEATKLTAQLIAFSPGGNSRPATVLPAGPIREEADAALAGSGIAVAFAFADPLWPITVEPRQFRSVIRHMVLNALEAMASREGVLTIMATNEPLGERHKKHDLLPAGNYVRISIQDQGCGIHPEDLPRIFDPYFSTKERGAQRGMGLGLTVCEAIVRRSGGVITVESELDKGTTFHIHLPAAREAA